MLGFGRSWVVLQTEIEMTHVISISVIIPSILAHSLTLTHSHTHSLSLLLFRPFFAPF